VFGYFSFVFAPIIKVLFLSNKQAFETYICFKEDDDDRIYARTHTRLLETSKPLHTPSKIIQKALSPLIFFTLHFTEFGR